MHILQPLIELRDLAFRARDTPLLVPAVLLHVGADHIDAFPQRRLEQSQVLRLSHRLLDLLHLDIDGLIQLLALLVGLALIDQTLPNAAVDFPKPLGHLLQKGLDLALFTLQPAAHLADQFHDALDGLIHPVRIRAAGEQGPDRVAAAAQLIRDTDMLDEMEQHFIDCSITVRDLPRFVPNDPRPQQCDQVMPQVEQLDLVSDGLDPAEHLLPLPGGCGQLLDHFLQQFLRQLQPVGRRVSRWRSRGHRRPSAEESRCQARLAELRRRIGSTGCMRLIVHMADGLGDVFQQPAQPIIVHATAQKCPQLLQLGRKDPVGTVRRQTQAAQAMAQ